MATLSYGIDTYQSCRGKAAEIAKTKQFVMRYLFDQSAYKEPVTVEELEELFAAGLFVGVMWENGRPTSDPYFTPARAATDAAGALACAAKLKIPTGKVIIFTVDCDDENVAHVMAYFKALFARFDGTGYTLGCYASGLICRSLKEAGLVTHTWLTQSHGFPEYHEWLPKADIVQGPVTRFLGMDVDLDTAQGNSGCWQYAKAA
jgi:hypothetical protein